MFVGEYAASVAVSFIYVLLLGTVPAFFAVFGFLFFAPFAAGFTVAIRVVIAGFTVFLVIVAALVKELAAQFFIT